ncbi:MAG: hypothetical protein NWS20_04435 [Rickettsiaceae bacterium]|nr:hypothetical protein [Rickettsiaceae bacterium]MDP5020797.1 hypothetical protein [Rickettsiaceae bacterium]MDP5083375.1 hypothetical protein [Rickettsiaceae bacterium]
MAKIRDSFNQITVGDDVLSTIAPFKAIVAPGKKRPTLDKDSHKALVQKKYDAAKAMVDYITLFRVKDKIGLPPKEIKEHTVPGPEWTPPSSVGFVMGAQSQGHRIRLATEPTNDQDGLLGKDDKPSIYAREITTVVKYGWTPRMPKPYETYGFTKRLPKVVFTPPSSPKHVLAEELQQLMNVDAGWNDFSFSPLELMKLSTPISIRFRDFLKINKLSRDDFDDSFLEIVVNARILPLIEDGSLSLTEMSEVSYDVTKELLRDEEVIMLLSEGTLEFNELIGIYSEYIEDSDNILGKFSFNKLYSLITSNQDEFTKWLFELNLSIDDIIRLYNDDYDMLCALANDNAISFFQEYGEDIDIEYMSKIYQDNPELFYALINDKESVLGDLDVMDFIDKYEQAQYEISQMPEDDPYSGSYDAYDFVRGWVIEDNCPSEFLLGCNSSDDESYD